MLAKRGAFLQPVARFGSRIVVHFKLGGHTVRAVMSGRKWKVLAAMLNAETNHFQGVHRTLLQLGSSGKANIAGLASARNVNHWRDLRHPACPASSSEQNQRSPFPSEIFVRL